MINAIPGLSTTHPAGALYCFVRIDTARFGIKNDEQFILDLLLAKNILLVHGTAFNWPKPDHFRLVFLPEVTVLEDALNRLADFLKGYRQSHWPEHCAANLFCTAVIWYIFEIHLTASPRPVTPELGVAVRLCFHPSCFLLLPWPPAFHRLWPGLLLHCLDHHQTPVRVDRCPPDLFWAYQSLNPLQ